MNLNLQSIKGIERRSWTSFRRGLDTTKGHYVEPITEDAFMFAGPEISKKRKIEYLKAVGEFRV